MVLTNWKTTSSAEEYAVTGQSDRRERQTPQPGDQAANHAPIFFQYRSGMIRESKSPEPIRLRIVVSEREFFRHLMVEWKLSVVLAVSNHRLDSNPPTESLQENLDDEIGLATLAGIGVAPA
ncbi:MAG: hypothetical protein ABI866_03020 [Dokdonella sp.]